MTKKEKFIIVLVGLLAIMVVGSFIVSQFTQIPNSRPQPIQVYSPRPTSFPNSSIPDEMQREKQAQENYAKARQDFLNEKPWISKLPLKSGDYFISYNPDEDSLLVSLYYSTSSDESKDQQIGRAKNDALLAMKNASIDTDKQIIKYIETAFK